MATSFIGGRSRREPPIMGKSSALFFVISTNNANKITFANKITGKAGRLQARGSTASYLQERQKHFHHHTNRKYKF
jgi:hypothetical protein